MAVSKYILCEHIYNQCKIYLICFQQPQKGKIGTKGQKQIFEENEATLKFYRNMIMAVSAIYVVFNLTFGNVFSLTNIVCKIFIVTYCY